jgi:hypothetical protein
MSSFKPCNKKSTISTGRVEEPYAKLLAHELKTSPHAFPVCFIERKEIPGCGTLKMFIPPTCKNDGFGICDDRSNAQNRSRPTSWSLISRLSSTLFKSSLNSLTKSSTSIQG